MTISIGRFEDLARTNGTRRIVTAKDGTARAVKQSRWERFRSVTLGPGRRDRDDNRLAHDAFLRAIGRASGAKAQKRGADLLASSAAAGKPLTARHVSDVLDKLHLTRDALSLRNHMAARGFAGSAAGETAYRELKSGDRDFKELFPTLEDFVSGVTRKLAEQDGHEGLLKKGDFQKRLDAWKAGHFGQANSNEARRLAQSVQHQYAKSITIGGDGFPGFIARQVGTDSDVGKRLLTRDELNAYLESRVSDELRKENGAAARDFAEGYVERGLQAKTIYKPFDDLLDGGLQQGDLRYGTFATSDETLLYPRLGREEREHVRSSVKQAVVDGGVSNGKVLQWAEKLDAAGDRQVVDGLVVDIAKERLGRYFALRPRALERQVPELLEHVEGDLADPDVASPFDQVRARLAEFAFKGTKFSNNSNLADRLRRGDDVIHSGFGRVTPGDTIDEIDARRFEKSYLDGKETDLQKARREQWTGVVGVVRDLEGHLDVLGASEEDADAKRERLMSAKATLDEVAGSKASDVEWPKSDVFRSLRAAVDRQLDALDNPPAGEDRQDEEQVEPFRPAPRRVSDEAPSPRARAVREETDKLRSSASAFGNLAEPQAELADRIDYAANRAAAPAFLNLAGFTFEKARLTYTQSESQDPRLLERLYGLQSHLRQFGVQLSNDDVQTLVDTQLNVSRYDPAAPAVPGRAPVTREGIGASRESLTELGRRLGRDANAQEPIVKALRDDIEANLAEIDRLLAAGDGQGSPAQPAQGGGRQRPRKVRFDLG